MKIIIKYVELILLNRIFISLLILRFRKPISFQADVRQRSITRVLNGAGQLNHVDGAVTILISPVERIFDLLPHAFGNNSSLLIGDLLHADLYLWPSQLKVPSGLLFEPLDKVFYRGFDVLRLGLQVCRVVRVDRDGGDGSDKSKDCEKLHWMLK